MQEDIVLGDAKILFLALDFIDFTFCGFSFRRECCGVSVVESLDMPTGDS